MPIILGSHCVDEVQRLCDRVAVIDRDRVIALGTPPEIAELAGAGARVRFVPPGASDESLLPRIPGVRMVERQGAQVVVSGSGDFVVDVVLALGAVGVLAGALGTGTATPDDAFVRLTGQRASGAEVRRPWAPSGPPLAALLRCEAGLALRTRIRAISGGGLPLLLAGVFGEISVHRCPAGPHEPARAAGGLARAGHRPPDGDHPGAARMGARRPNGDRSVHPGGRVRGGAGRNRRGVRRQRPGRCAGPILALLRTGAALFSLGLLVAVRAAHAAATGPIGGVLFFS